MEHFQNLDASLKISVLQVICEKPMRSFVGISFGEKEFKTKPPYSKTSDLNCTEAFKFDARLKDYFSQDSHALKVSLQKRRKWRNDVLVIGEHQLKLKEYLRKGFWEGDLVFSQDPDPDCTVTLRIELEADYLFSNHFEPLERYGDSKFTALERLTGKKFFVQVCQADEHLTEAQDALLNLKHPNVCSVAGFMIEPPLQFYFQYELLQDYTELSKLLSILKEGPQPFSEYSAVMLIKQLLEAVEYLHHNSSSLFEFKDGGIWIPNKGFPRTKLKVSKQPVPPKGRSSLSVEEEVHLFKAPEASSEVDSKLLDMWAVGTVAYCLLCGHSPFEDEQQVHEHTKWILQFWNECNLSQEAKHFMESLLKEDPTERLSPSQALNHPWIQMYGGLSWDVEKLPWIGLLLEGEDCPFSKLSIDLLKEILLHCKPVPTKEAFSMPVIKSPQRSNHTLLSKQPSHDVNVVSTNLNVV